MDTRGLWVQGYTIQYIRQGLSINSLANISLIGTFRQNGLLRRFPHIDHNSNLTILLIYIYIIYFIPKAAIIKKVFLYQMRPSVSLRTQIHC